MYNKLIAIVGQGAVGRACHIAWKQMGYKVVGYDVNDERISQLTAEGLEVRNMSGFATCEADMIVVCVGTPQAENGAIFLQHILAALKTVGEWMPGRVESGQYPKVVIRSTMFPGLCEAKMIPALEEASGLTAGKEFGFAHVPETLRETDAVNDALHPWFITIGEYDDKTASVMVEFFAEMLPDEAKANIVRAPITQAEAAKFIMNTFGAFVITFYNMWWMLLSKMGIDPQPAIDLSVRMGEGRLNLWYGTVAGAPFGGACLPKELAAFIYWSYIIGTDAMPAIAVQEFNKHMEVLAELNMIPPAIVKGYRRASAQQLLESTLEASIALADVTPEPPGAEEL